ncbi:hypothetical protein VroAM7_48830 (plasmid) [Vibrio rotiferianus]|uniref:Uncharacterized protein n=1 Tax=Vibrio rotiferianus TaxID=190895 RepID=A0A510IJ31_9VIBR|nr:hypothetical protein [Vibrio rotiferianus]BBL92230.1 hypothetical protein VroAM7_48830 [Vibrio rotiferianus]
MESLKEPSNQTAAENNQFAPNCELKNLLKHIPGKYHNHFKSIQLSPELGFDSKRVFNTLGMLVAYLGFHCKGRIRMPLPYARELVPATNRVTIWSLMSHCKSTPSSSEMEELLKLLPKELK